ncbi:MAG: hypothetical protein NZT92_22475, partial [Abditibacteriales bacterium]|nr:hypothetical protein [Abditibacteriales bacterium]MDW8367950.1 hypothetical protein [Abditibacteriales bacterium]
IPPGAVGPPAGDGFAAPAMTLSLVPTAASETEPRPPSLRLSDGAVRQRCLSDALYLLPGAR